VIWNANYVLKNKEKFWKSYGEGIILARPSSLFWNGINNNEYLNFKNLNGVWSILW
jgi:hypothetical protein